MREIDPTRSKSACAAAMSITPSSPPACMPARIPATVSSREPSRGNESELVALARVELREAAGESQIARSSKSRPTLPAPVFAGVHHERRLQAHGAQRVDAEDAQAPLTACKARFDLHHRTCRRHLRAIRDAREERVVEPAPRAADLDVGLAGERMRGAVDLRERRVVHRVHGAGERHAERDRCERERQAQAVGGEAASYQEEGERRVHRGSGTSLPPARRSTRSAADAARRECVTISAAAPARFTASPRQASTADAWASSRLPVGSSASTRPGRVHQRACDRRALHLAAGERSRAPVAELSQAHRLQGGLGAPVAFGAVHADEGERQRHVAAHVEVGKEVERLEHEAHVAPAPEREGVVVGVVEGTAVEEDLARIRAIEARDDVEQRGLSAAGLADDRDPLAARHLEPDVVEEGVAGPEGLAEPADFQHQLTARRRPRGPRRRRRTGPRRREASASA
jgi:hypothetical protein